MSGRDLLIYLSVKYQGDYEKIYHAITSREKATDEDIASAIKTVKSKVITILDSEYPDNAKTMCAPPLVLYYYGDISLLNKRQQKLAVVGSRECTSYGQQITKKIVSDVAKSKIIVSGLARGIDAAAHQACIESKGKTIAVIGCGIDVVYPHENEKLYQEIKKHHLLISEYPNNTKPEPNYFPARNRIIAGFADKVLVTEAYKNSGTNITVLYALKQGKDVMAVPYEADKESSCNKLIQDGAALVESAEDVLYCMK